MISFIVFCIFFCSCQILMFSFFWAENVAQKKEAGKFKISEWVSEWVSEASEHGWWCTGLFCTWDMEPSLFCGSFSHFGISLRFGVLGFGFLGRFLQNNPNLSNFFSIPTLHSTLLFIIIIYLFIYLFIFHILYKEKTQL